MNTTSFMAYLKRCLIPTLKRGDIVMMDSLPVHKVAGVRELIEAAGARLRYLPNHRFGKVTRESRACVSCREGQFGNRKVHYEWHAKNGAQAFSLLALANLYPPAGHLR